MEDLCHQVKELWEEVSTLCSIRDEEKKSRGMSSETLQLQESEPPNCTEGEEDSLCLSGWEMETPMTVKAGNLWPRRMAPAPPADLQCRIGPDRELGAVSSEASKPAETEPCSTTFILL